MTLKPTDCDTVLEVEHAFIKTQTMAIIVIVLFQMASTMAVGWWINEKLLVTPESVQATVTQTMGELEKKLNGDGDEYPARLQRLLDAVDEVGAEVEALNEKVLGPDK